MDIKGREENGLGGQKAHDKRTELRMQTVKWGRV